MGYQLKFDFGGAIIASRGRMIPVEELPVTADVKAQLKFLIGLWEQAQEWVKRREPVPAEHKALFRHSYDAIVPLLKMQLAPAGTLTSEEFPIELR